MLGNLSKKKLGELEDAVGQRAQEVEEEKLKDRNNECSLCVIYDEENCEECPAGIVIGTKEFFGREMDQRNICCIFTGIPIRNVPYFLMFLLMWIDFEWMVRE